MIDAGEVKARESRKEDIPAVPIEDGLSTRNAGRAVFRSLCLWTLISIGRPQDIFPVLGEIRIGLVIACITLLLYLFQQGKIGRIHPFRTTDGRLIAALVVVMCVSGALGVYPRLSLEFLLDFWKVFVFYLVLRSLTTSIHAVSDLVFVVICGTGMLGTATLMEFAGGHGRFSVGAMYDPNDLGMLIVTTIPMGLYGLIVFKGLRRLVAIASMIISIIALGLTQSRGAFFGMCFIGICVLINGTGFRNRFKKTLLLGIISVVLIAFMPSAYWNRLSHSFDKDDTGMGRVEIWKRGLSLVPEAPILGHGVGTFIFSHGTALSEGRFDVDTYGWMPYAWRAAHSAYVTVIVELGLVGFGIYMALCGGSILRLQEYNSERKLSPLAVTQKLHVYATMIQTSFMGFLFCAVSLSVAYGPIFFFLVGVSGALLTIAKETEATAVLETRLDRPRMKKE